MKYAIALAVLMACLGADHPTTKPIYPKFTNTFASRAEAAIRAGRYGKPKSPDAKECLDTARTKDAAITAYLEAHDKLPNDVAEAMYAGNACSGMPIEALKLYAWCRILGDSTAGKEYDAVPWSPWPPLEPGPPRSIYVETDRNGTIVRTQQR